MLIQAHCPIVERLVNSLMMHGRNNGKKLMTVRIVKHSFEIIHLTTGDVSLFYLDLICVQCVGYKASFSFCRDNRIVDSDG